MTIPVETTPTLVESVMNDIRTSMWERLPASDRLKDAAQAKGATWRVVVARWEHEGVLHYEAIASTMVGRSPHVVRLPAPDAAVAWGLFEKSVH